MIAKDKKRIMITLSKETIEGLKKYCKASNQTISDLIEKHFKGLAKGALKND